MKKKTIRMQGLFSYKYNTSRMPKVFPFGSESETYPTVPTVVQCRWRRQGRRWLRSAWLTVKIADAWPVHSGHESDVLLQCVAIISWPIHTITIDMSAIGIKAYPSSRLGGPRVRWHRTCWAIYANMLLFSVYFLVRGDVSKNLCGECAFLTTRKNGSPLSTESSASLA